MELLFWQVVDIPKPVGGVSPQEVQVVIPCPIVIQAATRQPTQKEHSARPYFQTWCFGLGGLGGLACVVSSIFCKKGFKSRIQITNQESETCLGTRYPKVCGVLPSKPR